MDQKPSSEQVLAALERIAGSKGFAEAGRLPGFLRHLVEAALRDETERLKESVLGVEAFQREAGFDPRTDPIVRVEARRLRSRLEEYYSGPGANDEVRILLPKGGYVPAFELRTQGSAAPPAGEDLTPMPRGVRLVGIIAGLAVVGIGLGYWQSRSMRNIRQAPAATVAVLPFENVGGDPENDYFSEGLAEEIIDRLARVPGLKVVSRSLMSQFRGKNVGLDDVEVKVGASVVVEGSVRRQGDRLRVVARLAKVTDGSSLWSQTYERRTKDVFAIQDEIAQSVANALRVQVRGVDQPLRSRTTENLEAYNFYLRGRQQTNMHSEEGMRRAITYYEDALKLEPDYAPALAALSMGYSLAAYYRLVPEHEAYQKGRDAAERAIALDPLLADAHTSLGLSLAFHDWKWRESEAEFRKAIEVDDSSALAHGLYATAVLLPEKRLAEAESEFRKALDLDPVLSFVNFTYGFALLADGRYKDAVQQYERALETRGLHPDVYWDYGMALGLAGRPKEARQAMMRARKERGDRSVEPRGLEALFSGDEAMARADAPVVEKAAADGNEDYMDAARLWAMLGEKERALECLTKSIERREPQAVWVKSDPRLRSLFGDARHSALVAKVGL